MRITQAAKEKNRKNILAVAQKLFSKKGYEQTTTRDISVICNMAKGTLFNYFKSKETLAMTMVAQAMNEGQLIYKQRRTGEEGFAEDLFLLIASELRALKPFRSYIGPVLESGMSVFFKESPCEAGRTARENHLKTMVGILNYHGYNTPEDSIVVTLYWSLYLGILAHWSRDSSVNQAESLALVDYSTQVFTSTVSSNLAGKYESMISA